MQKIIATIETDTGSQIYNVPLLVVTQEDWIKLQEAMECSLEVDIAAAQRFDAMERMIELLQAKINMLEKLLT